MSSVDDASIAFGPPAFVRGLPTNGWVAMDFPHSKLDSKKEDIEKYCELLWFGVLSNSAFNQIQIHTRLLQDVENQKKSFVQYWKMRWKLAKSRYTTKEFQFLLIEKMNVFKWYPSILHISQHEC